MKIVALFVTLLVGLLTGLAAERMRSSAAGQVQDRTATHSQTSNLSNKTAQEDANNKELARLYPVQLALNASMNMRVLTLLSSNDIVMARRVLILNLEGHASSLSVLRREIKLDEFSERALKDAQAFLEKAN